MTFRAFGLCGAESSAYACPVARGKSKPVRITEVLTKLLGGLQDKQVRRTGSRALEVFAAFDRIGPPVSDHAEPTLFKGGVLTLMVNGPTWLTELSFLERQVVDRLNEAIGRKVVRSLRLRLGSPRKRVKPRPPKRRLTPQESQDVEHWTEDIKDDAVRAAVARAAKTSLASGPADGQPFSGPPGPRLTPREMVEPEPEHGLTYGFGQRDIDKWKIRRDEAAASLIQDE